MLLGLGSVQVACRDHISNNSLFFPAIFRKLLKLFLGLGQLVDKKGYSHH
jgi:hypothetical protein